MMRSMGRSVSKGSWCVSSLRWSRIYGGSFVSDIGNVASLVICSVGHNLDTAIGQSYTVFSGNNSVLVLDLLLGEVCSRIGILRYLSMKK